MSDLMFARLDWQIAWRHLRVGDERPRWVNLLLAAAAYMIAVGIGFALHASSLDVPSAAETGFDPFGGDGVGGPTSLQHYYGAFGGLTLVTGLMLLVFAVLSRFFNLLATIITMSVLLGCMALVVVLSLMSGLEDDLREKILNQRAHIRVARTDGRPFTDHHELVAEVARAPEVAGASAYLEGEVMVGSGRNSQGAILVGIVAEQHKTVSNLDTLVEEGDYTWLSNPAAIPEFDPFSGDLSRELPWRLRHLDPGKKKSEASSDVEGESAAAAATDQDAAASSGKRARAVDMAEADRDAPTPESESWEAPTAEVIDKRPPATSSAEVKAGGGVLGQLPVPVWRDDPTLEGVPDAPSDGWEDPGPADAPSQPDDVAEEAPADVVDEAQELRDPLLMGRELAMELGVHVGAQVQLVTPIGRVTPIGQVPGILGAKVAAIFFSGFYEYDRKNVYAPLPVVQAFLRAGDRVSGIEVKLRDVEAIDGGKAAVLAAVERMGRGDELVVEDWRDLNRNLFSAMFLEKVAMFIALLFVVLVASFGILASNLMSVMEKSKEIAILKAMGASDRAILRVFIAEGLCVGLLGGFAGITLGLGLCWALDTFGLPLNENVYYIEKLPVVVNPAEVSLVGIAALIIVWVSSLYPARLASRMRPVDALRQADAG